MEQIILTQINQSWTSPVLDWVMAIASSWDFWWPFLALAAVGLAIWGGFRERAFLVCCFLCLFVMDGVVVNGLKKWVGRQRPGDAMDGVRKIDLAKATPRVLAVAKPLKVWKSEAKISDGRGKSFPSGHTANSFCVATVCFVFFRRWGWAAYLLAGTVGFSRVYTGSHWPSDVAVSVILAVGITLGILAGADFVWRRFGGRWLAGAHEKNPRLWPA